MSEGHNGRRKNGVQSIGKQSHGSKKRAENKMYCNRSVHGSRVLEPLGLKPNLSRIHVM